MTYTTLQPSAVKLISSPFVTSTPLDKSSILIHSALKITICLFSVWLQPTKTVDSNSVATLRNRRPAPSQPEDGSSDQDRDRTVRPRGGNGSPGV